MSHVIVKLTPSGGAEFEVKNVENVTWGVSREPGPNGHLGSTGHDIHNVVVTRYQSMQDGGEADLEEDITKLAVATGKKAYCAGTITFAQPNDPNKVIKTVRWNQGHICALDGSGGANGTTMPQTVVLCVTDLKIDNSEFKRVNTV
jgi:hypothetical protein